MKQHNAPSPIEIVLQDYIQPLLPVTKKSAKQLAKYFNTSPEFWINFQKNYDQSEERKNKAWASFMMHGCSTQYAMTPTHALKHNKMEITSRAAYELIKKYPGSPELGAIVPWHKIPGHQWPEFYRPISIGEMKLREERLKKQRELDDLDDEINAFKK